jgi:hypothetical protein
MSRDELYFICNHVYMALFDAPIVKDSGDEREVY